MHPAFCNAEALLHRFADEKRWEMIHPAENWPTGIGQRARRRRRERIIHALFDIGVITKGIGAVLEVIGGALLLLVNPLRIHHVVRILTQHELSHDPHDLVARYLMHSTKDFSAGTQMFGAIYLLWHGAVKVALVAALLLRQRWAYPAAIGAFGLFVVYQLYRCSHTHAVELLVLSAVDVAVIIMTALEYQRLRSV
jgi:uncharacterized membrane protein